jgi:hypothetical protein
MSETACKTRALKSSKVTSLALSNLATSVSSTESGLEGREEESTCFRISVSVASFDSLSDCGCGKVEVFIDKQRPVGFKISEHGSTFESANPCAWIIRRSPIVGESPLGSSRGSIL